MLRMIFFEHNSNEMEINMRTKFLLSTLFSLSLPFTAQAAPKVAVDIAPLHSLVSQVMEGVAEPSLIIPAEASPHHYTLRPSQARALSDAKIVFWVGENFTPWLEKAMDNVANSAVKVSMLDVDETTLYEFRQGVTFDVHEHDKHEDHEGHEQHDDHEGHAHHDDHEGHAHHDDHEGHEQHDDHEGHAHHDDHEGHAHHGIDPHAWLDPKNAKVWINKIEAVLSKQDPANQALYRANAKKSLAKLDILIISTSHRVEKLGDIRFIVFHDAYQYFEKRFAIIAAGSISLSDAQTPSPARIKEIRETVKQLGVTCVFTEPQFNSGMVNNVFEGTSVSAIAVMDPLGSHIQIGPELYNTLIDNMTSSLQACKK